MMTRFWNLVLIKLGLCPDDRMRPEMEHYLERRYDEIAAQTKGGADRQVT